MSFTTYPLVLSDVLHILISALAVYIKASALGPVPLASKVQALRFLAFTTSLADTLVHTMNWLYWDFSLEAALTLLHTYCFPLSNTLFMKHGC